MKIKTITHIYKSLKYLLLSVLTAIALYFLAAILFSLIKTKPPKIECSATSTIYIVSNGIHIDIILPLKDIDSLFLDDLEIKDGTAYVAFGWGDKDFYINTPEWSDLTFKTAFKALFLRSETAMHITFYPNSGLSWKSVNLCDEQLELLQQFIKNSFQKNQDGTLQKISVSGYSQYDTFFEAQGSFSLFYTCNVWVNQALKEAGIKTSLWSPFDKGILFHIDKNYN